MKTKKFDKELFEQYDISARAKFLEYLRNRGFDATENPDIYGIDILATNKQGTKFYFDVEVCTSWNNEFPFKVVHTPARKSKFAKQPNTYFVTFKTDLSSMIFTSGSYLSDEYLIEIPNKYCSKDEYFFSVPINSSVLVEIEKGV